MSFYQASKQCEARSIRRYAYLSIADPLDREQLRAFQANIFFFASRNSINCGWEKSIVVWPGSVVAELRSSSRYFLLIVVLSESFTNMC
jgi:hypothetical protein